MTDLTLTLHTASTAKENMYMHLNNYSIYCTVYIQKSFKIPNLKQCAITVENYRFVQDLNFLIVVK